MKIVDFGMVLALAALSVTEAAAQTGQELYQQALVMERSNGQISEAIRLYNRVVDEFPAERELAARALVRLGHAYEVLGDREARAAYRRVLSDYPDQQELVSEARARLAALQAAVPDATAGPTERVLLTKDDNDINDFFDMHPSPDGRWVAYTRVGSSGTLYLRSLETGDTIRLAEGYAWHPVWSPDGRRIAFRHGGGLEIVEVASHAIIAVPGGGGLEAHAWSRDGAYLLCAEDHGDLTHSLYLVSVRTGERRTLVARQHLAGGGTADLSPDGRYVAYTAVGDERNDIYVMELASGESWRITTNSAGGGSPAWSPDGGTILYQNQDGAWVIPVANGRASEAPKMLRDRPMLFAPNWIPSGELFYTEMQSSRAFYRIAVDPQTGRARGAPERFDLGLEGEYNWLAWSPDMTQIAAAALNGHRVNVFTIASRALATYPIEVNGSILAMWWNRDGSEIQLVPRTRPASAGTRVLGVSASDGATREVIPPVRGAVHSRMHISPDGRSLIYYRQLNEAAPRELVITPVGSRDERVLASGDDPDGYLSNWVRPQFSPDGLQVLFGRTKAWAPDGTVRSLDSLRNDETWEFTLWVVGADGSGLRKIATSRIIRYAVWDSSSRFVVYGDYRGDPNDTSRPGTTAVMVVNVETGTAHELPTPGLSDVGVRAWSSDGRWIGVVAGSSSTDFRVVRNVLGNGGMPR